MPSLPHLPPLTPSQLKRLAGQQLSDLLVSEVGRARERICDLQHTYPSADAREIAQRLVDTKKTLAGTSGAISGLFGLFSVPLDLVLVAYLQLSVIVDIATLHKVSLKSQRAQGEVLDLLGYANGIGPVVRASPRVLGRVATVLFEKGGLPRLGRAVPVLASPLTAWLNNRAIEAAAHEAHVFYGQESKRRSAEK